jgi:hypothetical protein
LGRPQRKDCDLGRAVAKLIDDNVLHDEDMNIVGNSNDPTNWVRP